MFGVFCNQKPAYEMRISDLSSDVCSSDLPFQRQHDGFAQPRVVEGRLGPVEHDVDVEDRRDDLALHFRRLRLQLIQQRDRDAARRTHVDLPRDQRELPRRSEEPTSELQSLMSTSYADFRFKKKTKQTNTNT